MLDSVDDKMAAKIKQRDTADTNLCPPMQVISASFLISFAGSFHFGYHIGIVNPTQDVFEEFLNTSYLFHYGVPLYEEEIRFLWATIVALLMGGALFSALFLSAISENLGRQRSFYLTSFLFIIGSAMCAGSKSVLSFELFAIGRFVFGFGIGLVMGIQPIYFTEIAPISHRGLINNFTAFAAEFGFAFSSIVGLPDVLGTRELWPYLFWLEMCFPTVLLFFLWTFPESPKYLMAKGRTAEALKSIHFFNGNYTNPKAVLKEIEDELEYEKSVIPMGIRDICVQNPAVRSAIILGCIATFVDPMSGEIVLDHYCTHIFEETGLPRQQAGYANAIVCCSILIPVVISGFIVDKVGRRPLLLISSVLTALVDVLIMTFIILYNEVGLIWAPEGILFSSIMFMMVFGLGPAAIQWYLTAEMVPQNARSCAQAMTLFCNYAGTLLAGFIFLPLEGVIGPYSFLMFVVLLLAAAVYFYRYLPETKGKKVDEILDEISVLNKLEYYEK